MAGACPQGQGVRADLQITVCPRCAHALKLGCSQQEKQKETVVIFEGLLCTRTFLDILSHLIFKANF